jgi:hypothetical protein
MSSLFFDTFSCPEIRLYSIQKMASSHKYFFGSFFESSLVQGYNGPRAELVSAWRPSFSTNAKRK